MDDVQKIPYVRYQWYFFMSMMVTQFPNTAVVALLISTHAHFACQGSWVP